MAEPIVNPTRDFVTSTLVGAITSSAASATIGSGLNIPAANGVLQLDYDSIIAPGTDGGPETVYYTAYNSGTGALTGLSRGADGGAVGVAHGNTATVQAGPTILYLVGSLGYAQATSNQGSITAEADLTGLAVTVTVPAGGRRIKITASANVSNGTGSSLQVLRIKEGSTILKNTSINAAASSTSYGMDTVYVGIPTAGSHTYKLSLESANGTTTLTVGTTNPAFILAELI